MEIRTATADDVANVLPMVARFVHCTTSGTRINMDFCPSQSSVIAAG